MTPGSVVELRIDSLAAGGDGVGRVDGRVVFVARTAPGDRVRARVSEVRRRHARAELDAIVEPGAGRRDPACVYFEECGGCSWMHLTESAQREARETIVRDALQRIAGRAELPEIRTIDSPRALGYRSRARVAFGGGRVGFRARRSHHVVDVEHCVVLDEATQRELQRLRKRPLDGEGDCAIRGHGARIDVGDRSFRVGPDSFFQANAALWELWLDVVRDVCGRGTLAVELYAGVGFYTVDLSRAFERVIAVERGRSSGDLRHNVDRNVEVVADAAENWAKRHLPHLGPDLVLLNPPRTGCDPDVADAIAKSGTACVTYVSCDPSTLARDVMRFGTRFVVDKIVVLDATPQTHGVETVCFLVDRDAVRK